MSASENKKSNTTPTSPTRTSSRNIPEEPSAFEQYKPEIYTILLLIFINVLVYVQILDHQFVSYDDKHYVYNNVILKQGLTGHTIKWAFTTHLMGHWHPITWITFLLEAQFFGFNPTAYHATNLIIHILNTLLLFAFLRISTKSLWPSAAVAMLFAIHPMHVQPVVWVASRKDLLSTFFGLIALICYYYYAQDRSWKRYLQVILFLVLGLLSKAMLITLPFVMLLLDYWPLARYKDVVDKDLMTIAKLGFRLVLEKAPMIILSIIFAFAAFKADQLMRADNGGGNGNIQVAQGDKKDDYPDEEEGKDKFAPMARPSPKFRMISTIVASYSFYIQKTFWPSDISVLYPSTRTPARVVVITYILVMLIFSLLTIAFIRKYPFLFVGWFWYLMMLFPVTRLLLADRYSYITLIGIFIIIAWTVSDILVGWKFQPALKKWGGAAVVIVLTILSLITADYWRDSETLYKRALALDNNNMQMHLNMGQIYLERNQLDNAIKEYKEVVRINPKYTGGYFNLAQLQFKQGQYDDSIANYNMAIKIRPLAKTYYWLAQAYIAKQDYATAITHLRTSISMDPTFDKPKKALSILEKAQPIQQDQIQPEDQTQPQPDEQEGQQPVMQ